MTNQQINKTLSILKCQHKDYPNYEILIDEQGNTFTTVKSFEINFAANNKASVSKFLNNIRLNNDAPIYNYFINTPNFGEKQLNVISEDEFTDLIVLFPSNKNKTSFQLLIKLGVKNFHYKLANFTFSEKPFVKCLERKIQDDIIQLLAMSKKNFQFEVPMSNDYNRVRMDFVDLNCTRIHRIYELKSGTVSLQQIKEKLFNSRKYGYRYRSYFDTALSFYDDNKVVELIFTSDFGISNEAKEFLSSITDNYGYVKDIYLNEMVQGQNIHKKVRVQYQPIAQWAQPIVDSVYNEFLAHSGSKTNGILKDMKVFLSSPHLPKPLLFNER